MGLFSINCKSCGEAFLWHSSMHPICSKCLGVENKTKELRGSNIPQFAIYGYERRQLKKEANLLKSFIKNSWRVVSVNNDLYRVYREEHNVITEERQKEVLDKAQLKLDEINKRLQEPYKK